MKSGPHSSVDTARHDSSRGTRATEHGYTLSLNRTKTIYSNLKRRRECYDDFHGSAGS